MSATLCFLAVVALVSCRLPAAVDADAAPADCGHSVHGSTVEQGRYYYVCRNGLLDPQGCLTDSQNRVAIGSMFRSNDYQLRCNLGSDGFFSIEYDACIIKGNIVYPGSTFANDQFWYSCGREAGHYLIQQVAGCVYNGRRMNKGERLIEAEALRECRDGATGDAPAVVTVGCAANSQEYLFGENFVDDRFLYACVNKGGSAHKKTIGCVKDGKQYYDGQQYYVGETIFRCQVMEGKNARHVVVGCVEDDGVGGHVEKTVGCHWIEGSGAWKYTSVCQLATLGVSALKNRINCYYTAAGGAEYIIEPGCFRIIADNGIGCRKTANGGLDYVTFAANRFDKAYEYSLQLC